MRGLRASAVAIKLESGNVAMRTATSTPVETMSTGVSVSSRSIRRFGLCARSFGIRGMMTARPNESGAVTRSNPAAPVLDGASTPRPASAASSMVAANGRKASPSVVRETERVVRWMRRTPSSASKAANRRVAVMAVSPNLLAAADRLPAEAAFRNTAIPRESIITVSDTRVYQIGYIHSTALECYFLHRSGTEIDVPNCSRDRNDARYPFYDVEQMQSCYPL